ncbi:MAG: acyl-CoA dehydrogenase family protein [Acidimicrobiia bacterium]|nr:acyl-CoA dehydrogenase family protein [Acidimicrobiia bacterium]
MAPEDVESVEGFRLRARAWLAEHMPPLDPDAPPFSVVTVTEEQARRSRELQRLLYEGGFAGIAFPKEYGGLGLTAEHQRAFTQESRPHEMPLVLNLPTLTILAPTLLDAGTEEQKLRHIPAMLRGEELWVQFLSEPTGGSDLAGVLTRADRDGDSWVLNGAKTWSSYAMFSDYALCLARTDWDVPKHDGLTMFIVKIHQPGITVEWIRQSNGARDFCQEFFDDVVLPASSVVGEVGGGWKVASQLMVHERMTVGGASPYASGRAEQRADRPGHDLAAAVRGRRRGGDPRLAQLVGEMEERTTVHRQLVARVATGLATGTLPPPAGALMRLSAAEAGLAGADIALEATGVDAVVWPADHPDRGPGEAYVFRQAAALGGGSAEMQRNIISERLLGMPREPAADRDRPFREVRRTRASRDESPG